MPRPPKPGQWVRVTLPNGQPARVTTATRDGRRIVIVKPLEG